MQQDFHFYATMVLARAAGFNPDDARIIATACQYVDDSTEYQPINIKVNGDVLKFDPTCTSYKAINPANLDWANQKRVWIPFHFLPTRPFKPKKSLHFVYTTSPDSIFSKFLLQQAIYEPLNNYKVRLIRIGIALHTYADTFAHAGFSGRHSKENDVQNMTLWSSGKWMESIIRKTVLNLAPQIGHAEAGSYPDYPFQKWKCKLGENSQKINRDNTVVFLKTAEQIYLIFQGIRKMNPAEIISWSEVKDSFKSLFKKDVDLKKRVFNWQQEFRSMFPVDSDLFFYDKDRLRQEALDGDSDWDDYSSRDWNKEPARTLKEDISKNSWFLFHKGALHQRHLVLENIP